MKALALLALVGVAHAQPLPEGTRSSKTARYDKLPPYPSAPADPWAAVKGDQPVRWTEEQASDWVVRANEHECTAAADHCLLAHAWFFERNGDREQTVRLTSPSIFGPEGPVGYVANSRGGFSHGGNPYTAYRTVPATKTNLAEGTLAVVLARPADYPKSGREALELTWYIGVVDNVDFDIGTVKLKGHRDSALLTGARVVVLTWEPGKPVKIVGNRKRDQLAVKKADVILPTP